MAKQSIVPFGPQQHVLPEPGHLDRVLGGGGGAKGIMKQRVRRGYSTAWARASPLRAKSRAKSGARK